MKFRVTGLALAGLLAGTLVLPGFAAAAEQPSAGEAPSPGIYLDGERAQLLEYRLCNDVNYITVESFAAMMDQEAMVEEANGTATVTAVSVAEVIDMEDAGAEGEQANVVEETLTLTACLGARYLVANGRYLYVKDGVMELNGKVAAPIRVLAKVYNLDVGYDSATGNVTLTSRGDGDAYLEEGWSYYNNDTLYWLSRIIYAESGNQPLEGKIAVGNVVMNRVASPLFPNTIYDVLFQRNQFSPAISGSIYRTPNDASVVAAKLVMDGAQALPNVLFFNVAGLNSYASRNRPYVATIGNHAFYA